MLKWKIGDVIITQIAESTFDGGLEAFLPHATPHAVLSIDWLRPHFVTPEGVLKFSIHALVIETGSLRILVDTCVGNDKPRPMFPIWHRKQYNFLRDLEAAGFRREMIDIVLCTHLHLDHVGWNTMRVGERWEPTFPNARYLFGRREFEFLERDAVDASIAAPLRELNAAILSDSVTPIIAAGLADLVDTSHVVCSEVGLVPTPGHTPGHVSVNIASRGERAFITGDLTHHPCQLAHPDWSITSDFDPDQTAKTRRTVFAELAGTPALVIGTHWPNPTAGRIVRDGDVFRLDC
jgi:glyoxylase-like metal-dependent hydrolase (beta-lactamase superfamily II)